LPTFDFQFPQFRKDLGQLSIARRSLRGVLLHIDINPAETNVDTLLTLLDHLYQNPNDYRQIIYDSI
jgi:hypothetical protein